MSDIYNKIENVSVATFNTSWKNQSANQPITGLKVHVSPVQDTSDGSPSPTNVRPITGWQGANVYVAGKNLSPYPYVDGMSKTSGGITWTVNPDGSITANGTATANSVFQLSANDSGALKYLREGSYIVNGAPQGSSGTTYAIQCRINGSWVDVYSSGRIINYNPAAGGVDTFRLRVINGTTVENVTFYPMIRLSSVADGEYEQPSIRSKTISFGAAGTVYGGELDVLSGMLTVSMGNIPSYNGETIGEPWLSSMDTYSPGATPTTGAQVVYTLASPQIYQLTGAQIYTLFGVNNVWSNTGFISELVWKYNVFDLLRVFINGFEITDLIAFGGWERERSDVDGPEAGRTLDAKMHRARVATKMRYNVTCRPMLAGELASLERLIMPEYVTVKVLGDPYYGTWERTCYVNNTSAKYLIRKRNGAQWWGGITFPIIEV